MHLTNERNKITILCCIQPINCNCSCKYSYSIYLFISIVLIIVYIHTSSPLGCMCVDHSQGLLW